MATLKGPWIIAIATGDLLDPATIFQFPNHEFPTEQDARTFIQANYQQEHANGRAVPYEVGKIGTGMTVESTI
jgi:hypothetical protein